MVSKEAAAKAAAMRRRQKRPVGYHNASLFGRVTYSFMDPFLRLGARGQIGEDTAAEWLPPQDTAEFLAGRFSEAYSAVKAEAGATHSSPSTLLWKTYLRLYRGRLLLSIAWSLIEIAAAVGSPLVLQQFLTWLVGSQSAGAAPGAYPNWQGWLWAALLGVFGYAYAIIHHQLFWVGMRMGYDMRQQAIAAVQAKVLRLNAVAVSDVTTGKIVNLVSNDVRRFDDAATFFCFLIAAPVLLVVVIILIGLKISFAASVAGVATLLLVIPAQGLLVRYIGRLRAGTAAQTDERVRLTGEVIGGVLAAKMLGWEDALLQEIRGIRRREAAVIRKMALIKALNLGLSFAIVPISSLITFAVAHATSNQLTVPSLFYALALLSLPRMYVTEFFVYATQFVSELHISMRRLGGFLCLPEPPQPWHLGGCGAAVDVGGAASPKAPATESANGVRAVRATVDGRPREAKEAGEEEEDIVIKVNGVDFDWSDRSWAHGGAPSSASVTAAVPALADMPKDEAKGSASTKAESAAAALAGAAALAAAAAAADRDPSGRPSSEFPGSPHSGGPRGPTLQSLRLRVRRGELVAIVGEVGAGKSSVLAALLGELQPMQRSSISPAAGGGAAAAAVDGTTFAEPPAAVAAAAEAPVRLRGSVAYAGQVPWVISGTVRENITFGAAFDPGRYAAVLEACALGDDIAGLPAGDATELGERGINLSGGQKARLALARAAYSGAEIQLLDDPLSAVDPGVGRTLFTRCIGPGSLLEGTTRLLVTHQRQYLPACDRILVMSRGQIVEEGTYAELVAKGITDVLAVQETELDDSSYDSQMRRSREFKPSNQPNSTAAAGAEEEGIVEQIDSNGTSRARKPAEADSIVIVTNTLALEDIPEEEGGGAGGRASFPSRLFSRTRSGKRPARQLTAGYLRRFLSSRLAGRDAGAAPAQDEDEGGGDAAEAAKSAALGAAGKSGKLVLMEDQAVGSVSLAVYGQYSRYCGVLQASAVAAGMVGGQALFLGSQYWLAQWASKSAEEQEKGYWVWGYAIMVVGILAISCARSLLFFWSTLRASTRMHDAMLARLLRAPLAFFHTNPTGRILNRFSKDQGAVDEQLPQVMFDAVQSFMMVLGSIVLIAIVVPYILPVFVPLLLAFAYVRRRYLATSREVKRWEAVTRSPVYASLSAVLKGLPTIRAFAAGRRFRDQFLADLTTNGSWWVAFLLTSRWVGFRLDMLVGIIMTVAPLLMMAIHTKLSPRLVGLALSQSLQLSGLLQWMVRQSAEVENNMVSVERMVTYTRLEQEPPTVAGGGGKPPEGWPGKGDLAYEGVTAIYRPGLPPVLRGLTFHLPGGTSCGVVGRTGSGKSSLLLSLFRLIPVTEGRVLLGGVDVATLGLDALRRQLAVIPQDPVLFSGTLRSNLDPWGLHPDAALWEVLSAARLRAVVRSLGGLDARMAEAGDNFSVGQRQLLCLARALLQDACILALDEATANVDRTTDALIQQAVRECVAGGGAAGGRPKTLLVIAHRIDTILDCDHLLVLSGGALVEQGAPGALARAGGVFARLVGAARR